MVRHTEADDDESTPATLFDKFTDVDEGDKFDVFGESLRVGSKKVSAASHTLSVWGASEDTKQPPRYDVVVDARHESVEFIPIRGVDADGGA